MRMPRTITYDIRPRGVTSGGCCYCRMREPEEAARTVGCYRLAVQCPIRRLNTSRCKRADCSEPCLCKPKPPCPEPVNCEDFLKSVAEAEMALAQTLNAEGEKLKRIVESTDDFDKLLEADRAANRVLDEVICKEQALFRELERILEICGACTPETKDARASRKSDQQTSPVSKS